MDVLFRLAGTAVVALGMLSLVITGELSPAVSVLAVASSGLMWIDRRRLKLPVTFWNILGVVVLLVSVYAVWIARVHLLVLLVHLTVFFQLYRLVAGRDSRSYRINFLLAFSQLMLAAILTIDLAFLAVLVAFAVALPWAMLLQRVMDAAEADHRARLARGGVLTETPTPAPVFARASRVLTPWFLAYSLSMTVVLLAGTACLFLIMPRLQVGVAQGFATPISLAGFSEELRLGGAGTIRLNDEPVMRVAITDAAGRPVSRPLYHHGLALDAFDGQRWLVRDATAVPLINPRFGQQVPQPAGATLTQRYQLEPLESRVIFHVREALALDVPLRRIEAASSEGFYFPAGAHRPDYTVYSRITRPAPDLLRAAGRDYPPAITERYLQLPPISERVRERGQEWVGRGATPYDGVLVVQAHLRDGFVYSLDQPSASAADPIDHFLFESQEGHCEFYAAAMAVLLRSAGIPCRVVNGFQGGEYNPAGRYTIVRQRDAHAWIEVYYPGHGWQIVDPTPVSAMVDGEARVRFGARLRGWADVVTVRWRRLVLQYDQQQQFTALEGLGRRLAALEMKSPGVKSWAVEERPQARRGGHGRAWGSGLIVAGALALVLAAGLVVLRALRAGRRDPDASRDRRSRRFLRTARRGFGALRRRAAFPEDARPTPLEIAQAVELLGAVPLAMRYYAVRFGGRMADAEDVARATQLLRGARRWRP